MVFTNLYLLNYLSVYLVLKLYLYLCTRYLYMNWTLCHMYLLLYVKVNLLYFLLPWFF